jgi:hypothetical protein
MISLSLLGLVLEELLGVEEDGSLLLESSLMLGRVRGRGGGSLVLQP